VKPDEAKLAELTEIIGGLMKIGSAEKFVETVCEMINENVAAEREACAKLAEQITGRRRVMRSFADAAEIKPCPIAAAIRARGEATT